MSEQQNEAVPPSEGDSETNAEHVVEEIVEETPEEEVSVIPKRKLSASGDDEFESEAKLRRTDADEENDSATGENAEQQAVGENTIEQAVGEKSETAVANDSATHTVGASAAYTSESVGLPAVSVPVAVESAGDISIGLVSVTTSTDATGVTEIMYVLPEKVGAIIGTKGAIVTEIQTRSQCKVLIDQNVPEGMNRTITLTGTAEQVKSAGDIIRLILSHGPTAIHINTQSGGELLSTEMECSQPLVGRVIGGGGATIRELQARSGAKIQINQNMPEGVPRIIEITGTQHAIQIASSLIQYVLDNGPNLPPLAPGQNGYQAATAMSGSIPNTTTVSVGIGGISTISYDVPKMHVGKIIGRGGEIVNLIQSKSACSKVQIDQNVPEGQPCKALITGMQTNQAYAISLIQEIMAQGAQRIHVLPSIHEAQGGRGGAYGPGGGAYGPGGYGQGMPNMYGGGYGQAPAAGGYGGYAAPQYGGYGGGAPVADPYGGAYGAHAGYGGYGAQGGAAGYGQPPAASGYGGYSGGYGQAPAAAHVPVPQSPWTEHKTDDGNKYWYNATTGVSQWEKPEGF